MPAPEFPAELVDLDARTVYFPVRHHSPACARLVRRLIDDVRPAAVLIEGPADFNDRLDELFLGHALPIAIYSYARLSNGNRRGAYYPFCEYSPEWQALQAGRKVRAEIRFIDLPWADLASDDKQGANRYADAELRHGRYVKQLCQRLGVDDFSAAWDVMVEQHPDLTVPQYLERCHHFAWHSRALDADVDVSERRREAHMAQGIREALARHQGRIVVVTGGYHSSALLARVEGRPGIGTDDAWQTNRAPAADGNNPPGEPVTVVERGIALTPYSYQQLDSLTGYEAGMPSPGFYHQVWHDRLAGREVTHHGILARVAHMLRERKQQVSTADLVAVETMAQSLATLRGRSEAWRCDLIDAIRSALVKEELEYGCRSPFLDAVHEVFRGRERGQLAAGTALPPLVHDIRRLLAEHDLQPQVLAQELMLELQTPAHREQSRILHRLRIAGVAGFARIDGTDFLARKNLVRLYETWELRWSPEFDSSSIEAARLGTTLGDAAAARLTEQAAQIQRNAAQAAELLVAAALAGIDAAETTLGELLAEQIRADGDFVSVATAVGHLLFLFRYDEVLGTAGTKQIGELTNEAFSRGIWLLEQLGKPAGREDVVVNGVAALLQTWEQAGEALQLHRGELVDILERVLANDHQSPMLRGAAAGALARLSVLDPAGVQAALLRFATPSHLGDFLTGLFGLAREVAQRNPALVGAIDQLLLSYTGEEFLEALPAVRLAFTYFTPREKHHLIRTLLESLGVAQAEPLAPLEVGIGDAALAMAFETRLFDTAQRFGIRGARP